MTAHQIVLEPAAQQIVEMTAKPPFFYQMMWFGSRE
jgi:hypothetical protein